MIRKKIFDKKPDGQPVYSFTITNKRGASAVFIEYGFILQSLLIPDKAGTLADVVLGYDIMKSYLENSTYFGAVIGRYGNRIANGRFKIKDQVIQLTQNEGDNHIHGGLTGFDKKMWHLQAGDETGNSIVGELVSPDGEEGYPGEVRLRVTATLTDDNELIFEYFGQSSKDTILNPTQHTYFNLSGNPAGSAIDHKLQICSEKFTVAGPGLIPTGEIRSVSGLPFDFTTMKAIERDIDSDDEQIELGSGFDHNWIIDGYEKGKTRLAAILEHTQSGRKMEVYTDQPGMQFYSGNHLHERIIGKGGVAYCRRGGLCFEAQHYPDTPNHPEWPSVVLAPGEIYRQRTSYKFKNI